MSASAHIRPSATADNAALYEVHSAAVRSLQGYPAGVIQSWLSLLSADGYADPSTDHFRAVAELDGRVVAFGEVDLRKALIDALYVHPSATKAGVGSALLNELEARANAAGLRALEVLSGLNAEGFYRRHGYRVVGLAKKRVTRLFAVEGIQMEKTL